VDKRQELDSGVAIGLLCCSACWSATSAHI